MSATLFALVALQGTSLTFSPGYTTAAECLQQYKGPYVSCFAYDPEGVSWTAFFRLPDGAFRVVRKIPNEGECRRYIDAFRSDVPAACRQLAQPDTCNVACIKPLEPPPPPPAAKPEPDTAPKPDPAALTYRMGQECETGWSQQQCTRSRLEAAMATTQPAIQLAGGHYEMPGYRWIPEEREKETVTGLDPVVKKVEAPKQRNLPTQTQQPPEPFKALIDVVMLPFDFLSYPGRRDW